MILILEISEESESILVFPGLSLLGPGVRGRGLPPATMSMTPIYFRLRVLPWAFVLRDSRASETRARVKITPHEKRHGVIFTRARVSLGLLSLRTNGGLLVAYVYFHIVIKRKIQPKELPSHSIHCLLTACSTQQLKILVTALYSSSILKGDCCSFVHDIVNYYRVKRWNLLWSILNNFVH